MKILLWILFFVNVMFFAVMQWGGILDEQAVQAQLPLHEDKISLSSAPQSNPTTSLSAPEEAMSVSAAVPVPLKGKTVCMEWGDFAGNDLARATTALSTLKLGDKLIRRQTENIVGYWVYIPPMKNKAAINQKITQLKERGIDEYFIVSEPGPWLNAISLGVFKTQQAAQRFLNDLRHKKHLRSVQIGESTSKLKVTRFVLSELDAKDSANLTEIQKSFSESELKEVSCALTR